LKNQADACGSFFIGNPVIILYNPKGLTLFPLSLERAGQDEGGTAVNHPLTRPLALKGEMRMLSELTQSNGNCAGLSNMEWIKTHTTVCRSHELPSNMPTQP
jgi:hypothetical protein